MRTETGGVVLRRDYTPPPFTVAEIRLEFDLDPSSTVVTAVSRLRRLAPGPLRLDGDQLELLACEIDGAPVGTDRVRADAGGLTVDGVPDACTLRIVTRIDPSANSALMGLYLSNGNYYTQCEAEGFRRITYFPDRPDVMARYRVTVRAPREVPVLLSNGNLVDEGTLPDGRHFATWEDPFPKPSYLFALVAGRLVVRERRIATRSGRPALLQIWVEPGNEDKTGHAMDALERAIRWDEARFGLELDLERFMIVAVGDFNMGAMENKGLNVFNTKYVFANPRIATDADFAAVEAVIGHEYFHNWTGNRVTCRDWFQLTLKEGLTVFRDQEFSADVLAEASADAAAAASARAVKRIEDVRVLRATQFPEDAGPMAHPIRPESYQEINNFYTVTVYEKGAEVIRMLQTLLGVDGFRKGMDLYFARHDGQAVTCDDFVAAMADANGRDLSQFGRWYAQAGTPRVQTRFRHDPGARTWTLEVAQSNPAAGSSAAPLHVPLAVGLLGPDGRDLPLQLIEGAGRVSREAGGHTAILDLTEAAQRFVFAGVDVPPVPSLLRGFSAPVILVDELDAQALAFLAAHDGDPFNRWDALQRLAVSAVIAAADGAPASDASATLRAALHGLLADPALDPAFVEQCVLLPGEGYIAEQMAEVRPQALREARNAVRRALATALCESWRDTFGRLADDRPWTPDPAAAARRGLRNAALGWWVATGEPAAFEAAAAQFERADNMTDRAAALAALVQSPAPQREPALAAFAAEFADEPLVLDKWFLMQATMHRQPGEPPVLERVRGLMTHPAFVLRNPNKHRALIGAFCHGNLAEFHAGDGSGYAFWVERIAEIDPLNPQVAARLARALDRWRKFAPALQPAMRAALEQVLALPGLSGDVREVAGKALGA